MNLLLDTCSFLWSVQEPDKLSGTGKATFTDPANSIFLSTITVWEIALKYDIGKLSLPVPPGKFIPEALALHNIRPLVLGYEHIFHLPELPPIHKDPFDRMLICQAIEHGLTILTPDAHIHQYPVKTLW